MDRKSLPVYLSPDELKLIRLEAAQAGLSMSEYVRKVALAVAVVTKASREEGEK